VKLDGNGSPDDRILGHKFADFSSLFFWQRSADQMGGISLDYFPCRASKHSANEDGANAAKIMSKFFSKSIH
jgi:hypothetical protein